MRKKEPLPWYCLENVMAHRAGPRFMTVTEVAELMRVSKMTVYRLIHGGEMPAIRVGKSFRVPESAVQQMIDAQISDWADELHLGTDG